MARINIGLRGRRKFAAPLWPAAVLPLLFLASSATAQQATLPAAAPVAQEPAVKMDQVQVTAGQETQLNSIDRRVYNVGNDLQSSSGSAADVLQNIPSVEVDLDGNVSLRGDANVQILIDGKPSALLSGSSRADVLTQMPADSIERIEVITNPSARFKPDGSAGIINIVLKKNRGPGYSGSVRATVGSRRRYGMAASGHIQIGKQLTLSGDYFLRQDDRPRTSSDQRTYIDPTTGLPASTQSRVSEESRPIFQLGKLGAELKATPDDTIEEVLDFTYRTFDRQSLEHDTIENNLGVITTDYQRYRYDPENEGDVESNTTYTHDFGSEDRALTTNVDIEHFAETERNHYTNTNAVPAGPATTEFIRVATDDPSSELTADYVDKASKTYRLELGFDGTDNRHTEDNLDLVEDPATGVLVSNPQVTNRFYTDQSVLAFYATYRRIWGRFGAELGERFEATELKTDQITAGVAALQRYDNLYPSVHLSYEVGTNGQLQLSYSHRVNRPDGDALNPYPRYQDPYNLSAGNPYLKPEQTQSVEAGYQYKDEKSTYLATIYYKATSDSFTQVSQYVSSTTLLTTQENLGRSDSGGAEFAATTTPMTKLNLNASGNLFYNQINASNLGYSTRASTVSFSGKLSAYYSLSKSSMFQLNASYSGKQLTPQGYREPMDVASVGFKHKLADHRTSVVVTVSDLFNSFKSERILDTPEIHDDFISRRSSRTIYLGIVYRFGSSSKMQPKEDSFQFDN